MPDPEVLEPIVQPTGFFRMKARAISGMARAIVDQYNGEVPASMEALVALPGVGRKTANVVLGHALGIPGLPVDRHVLRVHPRHRADESGIRHVDERNAVVRLGDDQHGVLLQPPADRVVEHAAVVQRAVLRRRVHQREPAAVEHLGDEVREADVLDRDSRTFGQPFHLFEVLARDVRLLDPDDRLDHEPRFEPDWPDGDERLLHLHLDDVFQAFVDVILHEDAVLVTHLAMRPLQVQHGIAVDQFQPSGAAAGDGLGLNAGGAERAEDDDDEGNRDAARGHVEPPVL